MLVCRCEGLIEVHQVKLFVAGIHKSIYIDVKLLYLVRVEDAMNHARMYKKCDAPEDSDTILVSRGNSCGGVRTSTHELADPPKVKVALPKRRSLV
jgi:hypothetical protein